MQGVCLADAAPSELGSTASARQTPCTLNDPQSLPSRRTSDLLIGRQSFADATYFLTLCETKRRPALLDSTITEEIRRTLDRLHASADFALIAAVVMPDHVHLLGTLGRRLSIGRVIGKFKANTHRVLRPRGLAWQENFHEHRLKHGDDLEPFARYLFLNPYRAGLFPSTSRWPHWWRWGDVRFEFEARFAQAGAVPGAWLGEPDPHGVSDL